MVKREQKAILARADYWNGQNEFGNEKIVSPFHAIGLFPRAVFGRCFSHSQ